MRETIAGIGAVAVVVIGVALAFTVTGSPGHQRVLALDEQRVRDLETISNFLSVRRDRGSLPVTLPSDIVRIDPITKRPYDYERLNAHRYRLCATFDLAAPRDDSPYAYYGNSRVSAHHAGRQCFVIDATE